MKISVLGNIIDTEHIYQITPIIFTRYDGDEDGTYESECNKEKCHCISFKILFFNQKKLKIDLRRYSERQSKDLLEENESKLIKLREEVIKYWSNNQSNIPKIEFI